MKSLFFASIVASMFVLSGCVSVNTSDGATGVPQPNSCHPGYAAKFAHKNVRVEGSAQVNVLFGIFAWGTDGFADNSKLSTFSFIPSAENFAKSAAVYNTCRANKADTLVGTRYTVTVTDYFVFKTVKGQVAGFPATMNSVVEKKPYVTSNGSLVWLAEKPVLLK